MSDGRENCRIRPASAAPAGAPQVSEAEAPHGAQVYRSEQDRTKYVHIPGVGNASQDDRQRALGVFSVENQIEGQTASQFEVTRRVMDARLEKMRAELLGQRLDATG